MFLRDERIHNQHYIPKGDQEVLPTEKTSRRTWDGTGAIVYLPPNQIHTLPASITATTWTLDPLWPMELGEKPWETLGMVSSLTERDTTCFWRRLCEVMSDHHHVMGQVNSWRWQKGPRSLISSMSPRPLNFSLCIVTRPIIMPFIWVFYTFKWKHTNWSIMHFLPFKLNYKSETGTVRKLKDQGFLFFSSTSNLNLHSI